MPVKIKKKKNGLYRVTTPNGVKSKGSTFANAKRQARLLRAIDHGFKLERKKKGK